MDKTQAWDFIYKYIEGRSTAAEHEAFHEWLLNRPFSETEELLHEYSRLLEQKREYIPADPRVLERIEKYIGQQDTIRRPGRGGFRIRTDSRIRTDFRIRRKFLYAAAAVLALLIALPALYQVLNDKAVELPAITSVPEVGSQIAPGGDKAVLTLADGSRILLDDASGGVLARQGKAQVLKLDNGELAYESGSSAAREAAGEGPAPTEELYNTIETPRGGQYQLTLSDGTKVWLNAASSLRFPASFNGPERTVFLTGEAYFEVAPSFEATFSPGAPSGESASSRVSSGAARKRPFYVRVNDIEVKVLGTHFNIMAYDDERQVETTLLEGSVEISPGTQDRAAGAHPGRGVQSTRLYPGQRASLDKASETLEVKEVDVEEAIAWQKGYFQFNRADIYTIMRRVSRWYDIDVVYEGDLPKEEFVGKISRDEPLSKVLRIFKLSRIRFRMEGNTIIVMP